MTLTSNSIPFRVDAVRVPGDEGVSGEQVLLSHCKSITDDTQNKHKIETLRQWGISCIFSTLFDLIVQTQIMKNEHTTISKYHKTYIIFNMYAVNVQAIISCGTFCDFHWKDSPAIQNGEYSAAIL